MRSRWSEHKTIYSIEIQWKEKFAINFNKKKNCWSQYFGENNFCFKLKLCLSFFKRIFDEFILLKCIIFHFKVNLFVEVSEFRLFYSRTYFHLHLNVIDMQWKQLKENRKPNAIVWENYSCIWRWRMKIALNEFIYNKGQDKGIYIFDDVAPTRQENAK